MRWIGYLTLAGWAVLGGCAVNPASAPPTSYRLQLAADLELQRYRTRPDVLVVEAPEAPDDLRGRGIAYQPGPYQLRHYSRSRWADAPPAMLEEALVRGFERSRLFRGVIRESAAARADYRLHTELLQLEQNFGGGGSTLELTLRVQLTAPDERTLLGSRVIDVRIPATSDDAAGAVRAAHAALAQAVAEAVRFTAEALPPAP